MMSSLILFAQAVEKAKDAAAPPEGGLGALFSSPMMPIMAVMVIFFFLVILPAQRRQKREQENLMANLKKNDEVETTSGIIGIVVNIKEGGNEVTLKVDDNARIRVLRTSIARIRKKDEPTAAAPTNTTSTDIKPVS
jgi:preprotein translocase subunit YajC